MTPTDLRFSPWRTPRSPRKVFLWSALGVLWGGALLVLVLLALSLTGCWLDLGAMRACRELCAPRNVVKLSGDGCVCGSSITDGGAK